MVRCTPCIGRDDLQFTSENFTPYHARDSPSTGMTKVANILFAKELQVKFDEQNIAATSITLHPGSVPTSEEASHLWLRVLGNSTYASPTQAVLSKFSGSLPWASSSSRSSRTSASPRPKALTRLCSLQLHLSSKPTVGSTEAHTCGHGGGSNSRARRQGTLSQRETFGRRPRECCLSVIDRENSESQRNKNTLPVGLHVDRGLKMTIRIQSTRYTLQSANALTGILLRASPMPPSYKH